MSTDHAVFNHDQLGNLIYTHTKYYSKSIDLYSFLPASLQQGFKDTLTSLKAKTSLMSADQVTDFLVSKGTFSFQQGEIIKSNREKIIAFINTQPSSKALMDWFQEREREIADNTSLSSHQREGLLYQSSLLKYCLKLRIEQNELNYSMLGATGALDERTSADCSFWSVLACWVGTLSNGGGLGSNAGSIVAVTQKLGEKAITGSSIVGAAIGIGISIFVAAETCQCSVNKNVCQAPLTVAFPYQCYTYGTPLLCEAAAYGNVSPSQFVFDFYENNNLVASNELYKNFTANDYMWIPASYMTTSVSSLAAQVSVSCNTGTFLQSNYVGWYYLSDLGKPFFSITGNGNISLSQTGYGWNYSYSVAGPIYDTSASIIWQVIPSGYPNYSATGTIVSGGNTGLGITVNWDNHAGFANLKCTATTSCGTVVQYFTIHIM